MPHDVQAVPDAPVAPVTAFSRAQGAREGWAVAASCDEVLDQARRQAGPEHGMAIIEALTSQPIACRDLKSLSQEERTRGNAVAANVTPYGPEGCAAIRLGAHLSVLELEERLSLVALSHDSARVLPGIASWLDERSCGTADALGRARFLLAQASRDWRLTSDAAQVVAAFLRCHPKVAKVRYPGLRQDESYGVASRTLQYGFGPLVDVLLADGGTWHRIACTSDDPRFQVLALEERLRAL